MKIRNMLLGAAAATGIALALTVSASAYVVCNGSDCWYSQGRIRAPGVTFQFHPDDWYFHQHWDSDRDHHWHDLHEGRGYWKSGVWVSL